MKIESRPLKELVHLPAPFDFRFGTSVPFLKESIKKIGISHPPILRTSENTTQIIHGRQRIQAAHELNPEGSIEVKIYRAEELPDINGFNLCFFDNISLRLLNPIEKSNVIHILTFKLKKSKGEIVAGYFSFLQLPPKEEIIDHMLNLQKLSQDTKEMIASNLLQVDSALNLLEFEDVDRNILLGWIKEWRLGINSQKKLIQLAWEVFKRKNVPVHKLVLEENIKTILAENWNSSQKWSRLEAELKRLRFPVLSRMESEFQGVKKELRLPPSVSLQAPAYFEGTDYLVQFHFKNQQELKEAVDILNRTASENEKLKILFRLTGENV